MVKGFLQTVGQAIGITSPAAPEGGFDGSNMPKTRRVASIGTRIHAGYFDEEYLDKLKGHRLAKEFDKVRRSDPQVKMLLRSVKNPILGANYEVEPASDTPEDKADADLINHILFHDDAKLIKKLLGEALTCVDFGHAVVEKTFKTVMNHPEFGSYHGIESLDLISAKTIERWVFDKETQKLCAITQIAEGDLAQSTNIEIPAKDVMIFTLDKEGANYEGVSWLRACYGNFFRKNLYQKLNAIGIEKFAVPTPIIEFPQGVQNEDQFDFIMEAVELYCSGQANYMTKPQGYVITFEKNVYDPEKVEASIDKEDARMTKAFLANFLELGMNGSGAYALSNDLSDFFLSGLTHIADEITSVVNQDLIPQLIRYNRGPRHKYPQMKHTGISDKAGKELAEIISLYVASQAITPDDQLEEHLRKRHDLPKSSLIGQRKPAPAAPSFGQFGGTLSERIRKKLYG